MGSILCRSQGSGSIAVIGVRSAGSSLPTVSLSSSKAKVNVCYYGRRILTTIVGKYTKEIIETF